MRRTLLSIALFTLSTTFSFGQDFLVNRIDPPYWTADSDGDTLELLVAGLDLNDIQDVTSDHQKATVLGFEHAENDHYLYVSVFISPTTTSEPVSFQFNGGRRSTSFDWEIRPWTEQKRGLSATDYLYLITPDRFANGDASNDAFEDMNETTVDRTEPYKRHGGDIQGIIDHISYIQNLGITGLWISPLLENNEAQASYHGYAITDHYAIDPRFGHLADFETLVKVAHERNMKMVMDVVYNHFGDQHYLFLDPPSADWFNQWEEYTQTNYRATALMDPYASDIDKKRMSDGWFDHHMPDVNQRNPHVAKWLIQNSIWWIDQMGIDAFRIDTYAYPDQKFMAELSRLLLERYPDFFIFAETWVHHAPTQYWFMGENVDRRFVSNLQSVTDFQLYFAIKEALTSPPGWSSGIAKVYYTLAHDYLYDDPYRLVTFVDNHDEGRFFGMIGEDMRKYKIGLGLMLTTRGIPCLYYGTEILMKSTNGHGNMRQDFPGGWPSDTINKFEESGRTAQEQEAFAFLEHLGQLRRESVALNDGELRQWAVNGGTYAYVRQAKDEQFLILVNLDDKPATVDFTQYDEVLEGHRQFEVQGSTDFKTGEVVHFERHLELAPNTIHILEVSHEPFE